MQKDKIGCADEFSFTFLVQNIQKEQLNYFILLNIFDSTLVMVDKNVKLKGWH